MNDYEAKYYEMVSKGVVVNKHDLLIPLHVRGTTLLERASDMLGSNIANWAGDYVSSLLYGTSTNDPTVDYSGSTATLESIEPIVLKRMEMPVLEPLDDVVTQAGKKLGYAYPRNQEIKERFLKACREIALMPFEPDIVGKYRTSKQLNGRDGGPLQGRTFILSWQSTSLKKYNKPVPEFALQTALDIKKRVPECCFEIEELVSKPDPFLVAVLPDKSRYYLEVWNEVGFKQTRME